MRKLTIKDVAKHAGVSTATISRVLNGSGYVSEDVRRQVLASVKELNYRQCDRPQPEAGEIAKYRDDTA